MNEELINQILSKTLEKKALDEQIKALKAQAIEQSPIHVGDLVQINYSNKNYASDKAYVDSVTVNGRTGRFQYIFTQVLQDGKASKFRMWPSSGNYTVEKI